jgi:hypothetical protein
MLKISEKLVENKEDVRRKKSGLTGSGITESRSKLSDLFILFLAARLFTEYRQFI